LRKAIHFIIFWLGFQIFKFTKKTFSYSYYSFRKLFVLTKGKLNDSYTNLLNVNIGKYEFPAIAGVLGNLSYHDVKKIANEIDRDGFYIFKNKLSNDAISSLREFAFSSEATLVPRALSGKVSSKYDRNNLLSPRYQFDESSLLTNKFVRSLMTDCSLIAIAQEYLGSKPIQDLTAMWWSAPFAKEASSEAAQLYHFDMDRFKFIKFFFYLTDVSTETGPHCYIKGTHKCLPDPLWKDGRILDNEINSFFLNKDKVEITGGIGSIIAVDTRGLHKGKLLERGERLILQFEFTNSLFGAPYSVANLKDQIDSSFIEFIKAFPHTFQRFRY